MDILKTKAMLNFALFLILKGGKNAPFNYAALQSPILIRNDSLTSEESKAKPVFKYLKCRTSYKYLNLWS